MHRVFGCGACILVWSGNNVKRRLINIYNIAGCLEERTRSCCWRTPRRRSGLVRGKGRSSGTHADPHQWTGINGPVIPLNRTTTSLPATPMLLTAGPRDQWHCHREKDAKFTFFSTAELPSFGLLTGAQWEARQRFHDGDLNSFKHLSELEENPPRSSGRRGRSRLRPEAVQGLEKIPTFLTKAEAEGTLKNMINSSDIHVNVWSSSARLWRLSRAIFSRGFGGMLCHERDFNEIISLFFFLVRSSKITFESV